MVVHAQWHMQTKKCETSTRRPYHDWVHRDAGSQQLGSVTVVCLSLMLFVVSSAFRGVKTDWCIVPSLAAPPTRAVFACRPRDHSLKDPTYWRIELRVSKSARGRRSPSTRDRELSSAATHEGICVRARVGTGRCGGGLLPKHVSSSSYDLS